MMNFWGILTTIGIFALFYRFRNNKILKRIPILISVGIIIIIFLKIFNIDYKNYNQSAHYLSDLIPLATITLAYPLYKNRQILLKNKRIMFSSLLLATFISIVSVYICAKLFNLPDFISLSLLPKSTTMPIALGISSQLEGAIMQFSAIFVAITGVFGGVFGHCILKFLKVKNDIAIGLALGSASHVIGTAACAERKKDKQTASSTIALIIVGILSSIFIPMLKNLIKF